MDQNHQQVNQKGHFNWYQKVINKGQLKIGGHCVTIKEIEPNSLSDDYTCGVTNLDDNVIEIDKNLAQSHKEATLLHEIIHVINWKMEDKEVEYLAQAIYTIINDNSL